MKTFKEFLTESVKTYAVRIKVAGELPESFENKLKTMMGKYEVSSFKKVASTPIQEHPHEFPRIKNKEVHIFDIEAMYPMIFPQLEQSISEMFGVPQNHIKVKHPADPTETEPKEETEYVSKLSDSEYTDDTSIGKPLFGDEYNMSLFKELVDARKDSQREGTQGDGKIVDMGAEETKSPIVPNTKK